MKYLDECDSHLDCNILKSAVKDRDKFYDLYQKTKNEKECASRLTLNVKATEIDEVKDIIASFIFMLEDTRIDYRIRKQYLESCKYLKDNFYVNIER